MKVSMLTFSQTGNTLKVGKTIENVFFIQNFKVEHHRFLHRKRWKPQDADIIGIGCPCFEYFPAEIVPHFLDEMDPDEVYASKVDFKDVLKRKVKMKYNRNNPTAEYEYVKE
jgi:flavodoxin